MRSVLRNREVCMLSPPRTPGQWTSSLAAMILASGVMSISANAQTAPFEPASHSCAERGCPCQTAQRLAVVQDAQGFSIRAQETTAPLEPAPSPTPLPNLIKIGAGLKFDARLFAATADQALEATHASRR